MDGSRLLNAAIGLGLPMIELTKDVDSVSFCLSKVCFVRCAYLTIYFALMVFVMGTFAALAAITELFRRAYFASSC